MKKPDPEGDLFKALEGKIALDWQVPVVIRVDGRAFHTVTKKMKCEKPFDRAFHRSMICAAKSICGDAQNVRMAYIQSDEISILLYEKNVEAQPWFGNRLQKLVSISASIATRAFDSDNGVPAYFDARAFNVPVELVQKYFYWRYKDARRNSISMLAQSMFPHKKLQNKGGREMIEMCSKAGVDYHNLDSWKRSGSLVVKHWAIQNLPDGSKCHRSSWVDKAAEFENEKAADTFYQEMVERPVF